MAAVVLQDVSKRFGSVVAVQGLSLAVRPGEILTLLGPSGCGKTTTLRLIAGFERPDRGEIQIAGRAVVQGSRCLPPEARGVGMVFQDYALFPHLTVAQNVGFGLSRLPRLERARRISALLDLIGMRAEARRYPQELSGGQQQRVALARALATHPAVVLLDEPFSNLDAGLRHQMRHEVWRILKEEGATALLVTHDQRDAFAISDRVAVLNHGRLEQVGPPREVYQFPATPFVATFVGNTNLLRGRLALNGQLCVETDIGCIPCRYTQGKPLGCDVTVSVRPDSFRADPEGSFEGRVVKHTYAGSTLEVEVEMPCGLHLVITAHPESSLRVGDRIRFRAVPDFVAVVE